MNDYYSQSISLIKRLPDPERGVAIQVFVWVTFAERILTFQELSEVLSFRYTGRAASNFPIITRRLLDSFCQGLIVLRNDAVGVAHGSVLRYLFKEGLPSMTNTYDQGDKAFDHTIVEAELAGTLLDYLCSCPNPHSENGKTWSLADARDYPLLDYSLNYWTRHNFAAKRIIPTNLRNSCKLPNITIGGCVGRKASMPEEALSHTALCKLYFTHGWIPSIQLKLRRSSVFLAPFYLYVCLKKS